MKVLTLKRTHSIPDGTFGVLDIEGLPYCVTLELLWKNNATDISCVPSGEYICNRIKSPKRGYEVYELQNVPNRSNVEIHIGNSTHDILGCILLGRAFGVVETKDSGDVLGVQDSKYAFNVFMEKLKNEPSFKLVIVNV